MSKEQPPSYASATAPESEIPPPTKAPPPNQAPPPQLYPQPVYPSGQGVYLPQQQGATVVVTTAPLVAQYGPTPQPMTCPYCHNHATTRLQVEPGMKTHVIALILCMFGCIPCCLIPYCVDSCQNRNHYCPSCGAFLGAYDDMSGGMGRWQRW